MIIPFLKLIVERFRDNPEAPPALYIGDSVLGKVSGLLGLSGPPVMRESGGCDRPDAAVGA